MFFSESSEAELENGVRVAVMGGAACGKTSILNQYLHQVYKDRYWVTTGDIYNKELKVDGRMVQLEMWDTPGGYCFEAARQRAIRICDAFVLVFAVDKPESFDSLVGLQEVIREKRGADVPIVVAATKTDLPVSQWFEKPDLLSSLVEDELKCSYFKITARKEAGIFDIFCEIVRQTRIPEKKESHIKKSVLGAMKAVKKLFKRRS